MSDIANITNITIEGSKQKSGKENQEIMGKLELEIKDHYLENSRVLKAINRKAIKH